MFIHSIQMYNGEYIPPICFVLFVFLSSFQLADYYAVVNIHMSSWWWFTRICYIHVQVETLTPNKVFLFLFSMQKSKVNLFISYLHLSLTLNATQFFSRI